MAKKPINKLPLSLEREIKDYPWAGDIVVAANESLLRTNQLMSENGVILQQYGNVEFVDVEITTNEPWVYVSLPGYTIPGGSRSVPGEAGLSVTTGGAARFMKHYDGTVELQLSVDGCTTGSQIIFTLPESFRPLVLIGSGCGIIVGGAAFGGAWAINTAGQVFVGWAGGGTATAFVSCRFLSRDNTRLPNSCFPISFKTKFKKPPVGMIAVKSSQEQRRSENIQSNPMLPSWSYSMDSRGNATIQVLDLPGLEYGSKQRVKFLIFGDKDGI